MKVTFRSIGSYRIEDAIYDAYVFNGNVELHARRSGRVAYATLPLDSYEFDHGDTTFCAAVIEAKRLQAECEDAA